MPRPTAVSFVSDRFDLTWPAGADPNSSPPWGKDCAEFIAEKLPRHGILVPTEEPEEEDGGWYFRVEINTSKLMVSVNWWPVGSKPERNIWVVQVRPWPSLLPAFLGKTSDQALQTVCDAIDRVLVDDMHASAVHWMSAEELSRL